jgi:hypothetical protein
VQEGGDVMTKAMDKTGASAHKASPTREHASEKLAQLRTVVEASAAVDDPDSQGHPEPNGTECQASAV